MNILLDPAARPVIGHRGNRAHAPENTIESFAQAVAAGADALEFDVHLSSDGVPVVHHDATLERTTDGRGLLHRQTVAELLRHDAGAKFTIDNGASFPYRGRGHRIPTVEEVIDAFPVTPLLIELKDPLAATGVRRALESHHAADRTLVDSFHPGALRLFEGSGIAVGASRSGIARLMRDVLLGRPVGPIAYKALCVPLRQYGIPIPVKAFARIAPKHDCRVHVWTVNSRPVAADLWKAGVNGIITDDPAKMLKLRESLPV